MSEGEIALHDEHFVALAPGIRRSDEMKPLGRAVGEHDVLGRDTDQPAQGCSQPLGPAVETLLRQFERHDLPSNGFPRLLGRCERQGALMRGIQPALAREIAEARQG